MSAWETGLKGAKTAGAPVGLGQYTCGDRIPGREAGLFVCRGVKEPEESVF